MPLINGDNQLRPRIVSAGLNNAVELALLRDRPGDNHFSLATFIQIISDTFRTLSSIEAIGY